MLHNSFILCTHVPFLPFSCSPVEFTKVWSEVQRHQRVVVMPKASPRPQRVVVMPKPSPRPQRVVVMPKPSPRPQKWCQNHPRDSSDAKTKSHTIIWCSTNLLKLKSWSTLRQLWYYFSATYPQQHINLQYPQQYCVIWDLRRHLKSDCLPKE